MTVLAETVGLFDFSTLQPDIILDALQQAGLDVSSGLLPLNSYENRVYQFSAYRDQSARPEKFVVKFYRPQRWTMAQIQEEHDFAFELAEQEVPVVAPLILQGASLLHHAGYAFAVFPSRGGRPFETDNEQQLSMFGRFLGRMHQCGRQRAFKHRPAFSVQSYLLESQQTLLDCPFIPQSIRPQFNQLLQQLIDETAMRYTPRKLIRLHGDCHAGNLFHVEQGPFFVDLDDCRMGPAIQDIWMMLSGDRMQQRDCLEIILEEYEQYCQFDITELKLIESLRTMRMIHYMAWLSRRWQDPAFPLNFPWFATDQYWQQQCKVLTEQLTVLQQPSLSLVPDY